ncbi:MAG: hypothetical protein ACFCU3_11885 [Verrucomicrobiales bacterium]
MESFLYILLAILILEGYSAWRGATFMPEAILCLLVYLLMFLWRIALGVEGFWLSQPFLNPDSFSDISPLVWTSILVLFSALALIAGIRILVADFSEYRISAVGRLLAMLAVSWLFFQERGHAERDLASHHIAKQARAQAFTIEKQLYENDAILLAITQWWQQLSDPPQRIQLQYLGGEEPKDLPSQSYVAGLKRTGLPLVHGNGAGKIQPLYVRVIPQSEPGQVLLHLSFSSVLSLSSQETDGIPVTLDGTSL